MRLSLALFVATMFVAPALADTTQGASDAAKEEAVAKDDVADVPVQKKTGMAIPESAELVVSVAADSIHVFPELQVNQPRVIDDALLDVAAIDNVYQSKDSYRKLIHFFEKQFADTGAKAIARTELASATAWLVKLQEGTLATVIVRNTHPRTIETIQAAEEADMAPPAPSGP